jgi:hypothetical protein
MLLSQCGRRRDVQSDQHDNIVRTDHRHFHVGARSQRDRLIHPIDVKTSNMLRRCSHLPVFCDQSSSLVMMKRGFIAKLLYCGRKRCLL